MIALNERRYLGDGVYARSDGYYIVLETDLASCPPEDRDKYLHRNAVAANGDGPSNTICLEPKVLTALDQYKADLVSQALPTD